MNPPISYWLEALQDRYFIARVTAARVLATMAPEIPEAVPALILALQDKEAGVRDVAAEALGALGPAARPAVPALLATLEDRNSFVRTAARKALQQIDPDLSLPSAPALPRPERSCV
jgi:HEAT repeat protein